MTLLLLGLYLITGVATSGTAFISAPSRHQMTTTTFMAAEERRVFDSEHLQASLGGRQQQQQQQQKLQRSTTTDRRVIPWVSIAVLLNILFFFRSIAAPFFDPLVSTYYTNLLIYTTLSVLFVGACRIYILCTLKHILLTPHLLPPRSVILVYSFNRANHARPQPHRYTFLYLHSYTFG